MLFLPPYSPEYNPIERVWSFLKSKIRQRFFKTADIFRKFVFDLFANINNTDFEELAKSLEADYAVMDVKHVRSEAVILKERDLVNKELSALNNRAANLHKELKNKEQELMTV